ncbi:MAG: O-methyltransferase [Fimbriimonadales bacterium]
MQIVDSAVEQYMRSLAPSHHPVLREMEAYAAEKNFPIIGPLCGRLLYQYSVMLGAKQVFEMGSGYGYSTFWFAMAVGPDGRVVYTDKSEANCQKAKEFLGAAGLADRVVFEVDDALEAVRRYDGPFDVMLIDVDKPGYPEALRLAKERVRVGGLIITDNVLWSGAVAHPPSDRATEAILEYNRAAYDDPELLTTILSVRDGLAVSLRLGNGVQSHL